MSLNTVTGLLLGLGFGGSLLLLAAALRGWRPATRRATPEGRGSQGRGGSSLLWSSGVGRRAGLALALGMVVLFATRWPVAALAGAAAVFLSPLMFGSARAAAGQVERLEALATWTESLRDSIAGSVGLEEAIRHSQTAAPPVLLPALQRLGGRLRVQIPLPQALAGFAEEFEDSSADLVVAALILNSRLRGPGLVATLGALATAAREEIDMRRRIEERRKSLRRTALIIVAATASFATGVTVFSRDYVEPYATPVGQVMLALVLAIFAVGLVWIRNAADIKPPARFLVGIDEVEGALEPARRLVTASAGSDQR